MRKDININFAPAFSSRWGYGKPRNRFLGELLDFSLDRQLAFSKVIGGFSQCFNLIEINEGGEVDPFWNQDWFPPLDCMSLYSILAHYNPNNYLEIGSGNSTKFARRAILDHNLSTIITSIDPAPRAEIDSISDKVIRKGLEDVSSDTFIELGRGDVVFFDGSHLCFQNSDVTVFFLEVLPSLKPGVIIGIHDIFLPNDYPPAWLDRYYNEQFMLAAYILGTGLVSTFPVVFAANYMYNSHLLKIMPYLSDDFVKKIRSIGKDILGGLFGFLSLKQDIDTH